LILDHDVEEALRFINFEELQGISTATHFPLYAYFSEHLNLLILRNLGEHTLCDDFEGEGTLDRLRLLQSSCPHRHLYLLLLDNLIDLSLTSRAQFFCNLKFF
jgi:hypothetical protein